MSVRLARILCPTDFSDSARRALDHAVAIARWYGSALTVLHVHRLSAPAFAAAPVPMPAALQPITLSQEERDELTGVLDEHVAAERAAGARVATLLDEAFDVPAAIVASAQALGADLIALGTHGRSGFRRLLLGSVTEKVLRTAECPVLSVPPHADDSASRTLGAHPRILCPLDFSAAGSRALHYAASLAREAEAQLTVLTVIDLPSDLPVVPQPDLTSYREALFEEGQRQLAGAIAEVKDITATPLVTSGKPYQEILRVATAERSDLIVMGVRGRGALDLAFVGSTTQHVVRQATCPVLTVREAT